MPVRVWSMALFAWAFEAATVAVLIRQNQAYKKRSQTREKGEMSLNFFLPTL